MKGIYLSQEGKEEIEKRIDKLKNGISTLSMGEEFIAQGVINHLTMFLESATILPVEESWNRKTSRQIDLYSRSKQQMGAS